MGNLHDSVKEANSVDNLENGHILPSIQNIILRFGPLDQNNIHQGILIANKSSLLNPDGITVSQSRVWVPLIWMALANNGYDVLPNWIYQGKNNLEEVINIENTNKFIQLVNELSSIENWAFYALEVLTSAGLRNDIDFYNDNSFENNNIIRISEEYKQRYINKDFTKYK